MHYLILEDVPLIRDVLKEAFALLDIDGKFTFLENIEEAQLWLEQFETWDTGSVPDVIFIDIRTQPNRGNTLAESIRTIPALSFTRLILMIPPDMPKDYLEE